MSLHRNPNSQPLRPRVSHLAANRRNNRNRVFRCPCGLHWLGRGSKIPGCFFPISKTDRGLIKRSRTFRDTKKDYAKLGCRIDDRHSTLTTDYGVLHFRSGTNGHGAISDVSPLCAPKRTLVCLPSRHRLRRHTRQTKRRHRCLRFYFRSAQTPYPSRPAACASRV